MKALLITLLLSGWVAAQPALDVPRLGMIVDQAGSLRPLLGFTGNLLLGDSLGEGVLSAASSGTHTIAKTDSAILVLDRSGQVISGTETPSGPALFSFQVDGSPALTYSAAGLLVWRTDHFETLPVNIDGAVVALGASIAVVQRDDGLWRIDLSIEEGSVLAQTALTMQTSPLLFLSDGRLVYSDGTALVIGDRRINIDEPINSLSQMGSAWILVNRRIAIRTTPGREQISQVPEAE